MNSWLNTKRFSKTAKWIAQVEASGDKAGIYLDSRIKASEKATGLIFEKSFGDKPYQKIHEVTREALAYYVDTHLTEGDSFSEALLKIGKKQ